MIAGSHTKEEAMGDCLCSEAKSIFQQFGYTYFLAQGVEAELGILYTMAFAASYKPGEHDLGKLTNVTTRSTFGHINRQLNIHLNLSDEGMRSIEKAIAARNYLAHDFFREFVPTLLGMPEISMAVSKLNEICDQLAVAKQLLRDLNQDILSNKINLKDFVAAS